MRVYGEGFLGAAAASVCFVHDDAWVVLVELVVKENDVFGGCGCVRMTVASACFVLLYAGLKRPVCFPYVQEFAVLAF